MTRDQRVVLEPCSWETYERLAAGTYQPASHSGFLPVTATRLTETLRQFEPATWPGRLRAWARAL